VTPNADNCCALLSNILAGQRKNLLAMRGSVYLYGTDASGGAALALGWGRADHPARHRPGASSADLARPAPWRAGRRQTGWSEASHLQGDSRV